MKGIVPSLNTPFNADGSVDYASVRRLIHHTVEAGCGGMLGLAVAGEHTALTRTEKMRIVEVAVEANDNRIPFVVSVTAPDPSESLELARLAMRTEANGICVQLPKEFDRQRNLEFLQMLAGDTPGILMVQDLDWNGGGLSLDEIVYLHDNIDAFNWLKIETQQAGPKYSAVLQATHGVLNVCGGWAVTQLMDAMARGVDAFIPTGMERVYVAIYRHYVNGDISAARALFEKALPVLNFSNQNIDTSIQFFKSLRKAEGLFDTDLCRLANFRFDDVQQTEADHAMKTALSLIRDHK